MATVPLSGTNIRLLSGVPFSSDYKHTRWHTSLDAQIVYFNNGAVDVVHAISQANFQRQNNQTFIRVDKSIDEIFNVNYLRFQNADYNSKWFYAFVTKLEYVQRNTTYVHFEIDVMQTYMFDFKFKPSFLVREHCKLWNTDGSPVINTVDEGLNYGTEYDVVGATQYSPNSGVLFLVIVAKSTLHVADGQSSNNFIKASMNGTIQPLSIYFHPFDIFGDTPNIVIDGVEYQLDLINNILSAIYTNPNAVNSVVSLYITDHIGIDFTYDTSVNPAKLIADTGIFQTIEIADITNNGTLPPPPPTNTVYVKEALNYRSSTITGKPKYQDFQAVEESKLLMYPYAFNILDDFKGNRIIIKNEHVDGNTLNVEVMGSLGVSNKVAYIPKDYLMDNISPSDQKLISIENAMIDNSPHDVSIITDMLAAFLQGNRNSLNIQKESIILNGLADAIGSVIGGAASAAMGNGAGIASAGVGLVKGAGNTVLQLQAIQAKQKDINNTPPSLSKMGSNTSFDYGNGYNGFWMISKQIKPEYRKKLTDFFKAYGYKVNEIKMPNLYTRKSWNYVQTNSCNITGSFNTEDLNEIKGVFDGGITLWHTNDVGNYDLLNPVYNPDLIAPNDVTNLVASNVQKTTLTLTWTPSSSTGVKYYRVYQDDILIKTVAHPTVTLNVTGLGEGETYTFTVITTDISLNASSGVSVTVKMGAGIITFFDSFDRADSGAGIGTSSSGHEWTTVSGFWGISNNELYINSTISEENRYLAVSPHLGTGNYLIFADVKGDYTSDTDHSKALLVFRYLDANNYMTVEIESGVIYLYTRELLTEPWGILAEANLPEVSNGVYFNLKVEANVDMIKVYVNNILKITCQITGAKANKFRTADRVGVTYAYNGALANPLGRWNNFNVKPDETFVGVTDNFNRADSTTSLGTSTDGHVWTPVSGTWGINSNQAYNVNNADSSSAIVTAASSGDYIVSCDISGTLNSPTLYYIPFIIFRYGNSNTYLYVRLWNGKLDFNWWNFGLHFDHLSVPHPTVDGQVYNVKVECKGGSVKIYVDNVLKIDGTNPNSGYLGNKPCGIGVSKPSTLAPIPARFNNFNVENN